MNSHQSSSGKKNSALHQSARLGLLALLLPLAGCLTATDHRNAVNAGAADRLTLGTVQKEIRKGMSGADVVVVLGSPNMVTTDDARREVWVYDKAAREVVHSTSGLQIIPLLGGGSGSFVGGAAGSVSQSAGATVSTDRMLTVVIKFDEEKKVRDWAYHATQF